MKSTSPLDTLIERSRDARDRAGQALAQDRRTEQLTARQLDTLQTYRQEYHRRLHAALMAGMNVGEINNYRRFMQSLDLAIGNADVRLKQDSSKVTASQRLWRARQRQLSSYDALASRRAAREQVREARQEQRRSDEVTTNTQARQRSRHP